MTITPTFTPERVPQPGPDRPRRGVGVLRQQQHRAGRGVGRVDPGRRHHQTLPVLHDPGGPRRATTRTVSASIAASRSSACDDPALGLGDDLRGDEQDVAVGQARRPGGRDQLGEVVPGADLRQSGQGAGRGSDVMPRDLLGQGQRLARPSRRWRPGPSSSAARRGSGCPPPRHRHRRRVDGVDQPAVEQPGAVVQGDRRAPWTRRRPRRAPCRPSRAPGRRRRSGDRPTTGTPASRDRLADAGHGQDRADADHRVGRREEHDVGRGDRLQHAGRRLRLVRADRDDGVRGPRTRAAAPSTPGSARPCARRGRVVDAPHASRPGRRSSAAAAPRAASGRTAPR